MVAPGCWAGKYRLKSKLDAENRLLTHPACQHHCIRSRFMTNLELIMKRFCFLFYLNLALTGTLSPGICPMGGVGVCGFSFSYSLF